MKEKHVTRLLIRFLGDGDEMIFTSEVAKTSKESENLAAIVDAIKNPDTLHSARIKLDSLQSESYLIITSDLARKCVIVMNYGYVKE